MARAMTQQERIDAKTLSIEEPSRMVGSGFIQFAPQRPFERPVLVQPATVATREYEELERSRAQQGGSGGYVAGGRGGYQGDAGGYGAGGRGSYRAPPPQQSYQVQAGRGGGPGRGGRGDGPARGALPPQQQAVQRPAPAARPPAQPTAQLVAASNGRGAAVFGTEQVSAQLKQVYFEEAAGADTSKLSKAQRQRMRKKLREGGQ